ncbi:SDR family NAD(P)-dependent oxidoreductase (plasmid) [Salipiger sp. H15]|uniref:SDR family NAD(P)-dependent oxidoreductase n=1 Tax=Alloyangia sp. H15 TaxID=3029062 RepID=A0AAU8AQQ2_9RHOB
MSLRIRRHPVDAERFRGDPGRGAALRLGQVVVADRDATKARGIADQIGNSASAIEVDVRDSVSVEAIIEAPVSTFGGIDILMNSAGRGAPGAVSEVLS